MSVIRFLLFGLLAMFVVLPAAGILMLVGLPILAVLAVVGIPVLGLLLLVGLPIFLVFIFCAVALGLVFGLLGLVVGLGIAALKIAFFIALPVSVDRLAGKSRKGSPVHGTRDVLNRVCTNTAGRAFDGSPRLSFLRAFASGTRTVHANTDFTDWATGVPLVLRRDVATGPLHVDTAEAFVRQGER
jgi:hypothetical protein